MPHAIRFLMWWLSLAAAASGPAALRANGTEAGRPTAVLHLADGDHFAGTLEDSQAADVIQWQSVGAARPFRFPASSVRAAYFPPQPDAAPIEADYRFDFADGDIVFGSLEQLTPEELEIESPRYGRLRIDFAEVRQITRTQGLAAWEYSGPNSRAEWKQQPDNRSWHEEAGHLVTEVAAAALRKEIGIPRKARVELALSWNDSPDFVFAMSTGEGEEQETAGYRFEVWGDTLVAIRELADLADVTSIGSLARDKNRIHLEAYLDQEKGSLSIHAIDGTRLGEIRVEEAPAEPLSSILLHNLHGNVRLESLVISRWNGQLPPQVDVDRPRIHQTDGAIVYGEVVGYDAAAKQFIVRKSTQDVKVDAGELASVVLHSAASEPAGSLRIGFQDGSRISGMLSKVASGQLHLSRRGVEPTLAFPAADVRSLVGLRRDDEPESSAGRRQGRLELDGVQSRGYLVDGKSDGRSSCVVWQPRHSVTSSPLRDDVSAKIVYVDRRPPRQPAADRNAPAAERRRPAGFFGGLMEGLARLQAAPQAHPSTGDTGTLFLLAGDRIPCEVVAIDDEGVRFTSSVIEAEFIPHEKMKALEFSPHTAIDALSEEKRRRLLTLPRMQRDNPPTHLLLSTSGDLLRARLLSLDGESLVVESRLDTKEIPRSRVACLIWLHDSSGPLRDSSEDQPPISVTESSAADPRLADRSVQAVRADGVRLTFVPHECADNALIGRSELLGVCRVDLSAVDAVLLGDMIETEADEQTYHGWTLRDAVEPRFARASAEGAAGAASGFESSLVGNPAPDFRLELLEGGHFRLSEQKGRVVVLDFWASWCGPCMQAMPQIHRAADEFRDRGVTLVAVNVQEDRATIAGALERLDLPVDVALDIDGATAEKYEVTAIPQTVIIDPEGNVARLFIGSGPEFGAQLRETLQSLVANGSPPAEPR